MTKFSAPLLTALSIASAAMAIAPALAQRQSDPNIGHFYMARQQITITDEAPMVNDQRTNPAAAQAGMGGMPGGPMPLPRAGWQPYSQSIPSLRTSLPKTNNGVPEKAPPPPPMGMRGRAGGLINGPKTAAKPKSSQPPAPSAPVVKAYSPYKQYAPDSAAAGSAAMQSNSAVRGSVLHWARPRKNY
ncbi:MAG: hypothetical protein EKK48_26890 [Candidatus Melainabacteria bacterium]|nr:MAG: hypothetical protein EKK48_26890 [Candidatus Melainabacteria bacterium]